MGSVQSAISSSVSGSRTETTLISVWKHTADGKVFEWILCPSGNENGPNLSDQPGQRTFFALGQHGMTVSRERRCFQHISDIQSRAHELYSYLPPELEKLASLAWTHMFPCKHLRLGGTGPSLCTSSPSCDMLGWHFSSECVGAASEQLPAQEASTS